MLYAECEIISFTLLLVGTFPIDSNHSPSQRDRLRQTTKDRRICRTAQGHTSTQMHTQKFTHKRPVNTHSDTHSQGRLDVPRNKLAFIHLDLHSRRPMDVQFQTQAHSRPRALIGTSHLGIWSPEKYIDIRRIRKENVEIYIATSTPDTDRSRGNERMFRREVTCQMCSSGINCGQKKGELMGENSAGGWGVRTVITLVGVRNEQGLQRWIQRNF